jgi:hypothetical protein
VAQEQQWRAQLEAQEQQWRAQLEPKEQQWRAQLEAKEQQWMAQLILVHFLHLNVHLLQNLLPPR